MARPCGTSGNSDASGAAIDRKSLAEDRKLSFIHSLGPDAGRPVSPGCAPREWLLADEHIAEGYVHQRVGMVAHQGMAHYRVPERRHSISKRHQEERP
jgi:hypothetical protein